MCHFLRLRSLLLNNKIEEITMKKYKVSFCQHIEESDKNYETLKLVQNLEAKGGDHFKAEINLERWRPKAMLVKYLRTIANIIENHPINDEDANAGKYKWTEMKPQKT